MLLRTGGRPRTRQLKICVTRRLRAALRTSGLRPPARTPRTRICVTRRLPAALRTSGPPPPVRTRDLKICVTARLRAALRTSGPPPPARTPQTRFASPSARRAQRVNGPPPPARTPRTRICVTRPLACRCVSPIPQKLSAFTHHPAHEAPYAPISPSNHAPFHYLQPWRTTCTWVLLEHGVLGSVPT